MEVGESARKRSLGESVQVTKNQKTLLPLPGALTSCSALQGLKTGMYYLRTKPAANPIQFTLNKEKLKETKSSTSEEEEAKERNTAAMVCSLANREDCMMCGS